MNEKKANFEKHLLSLLVIFVLFLIAALISLVIFDKRKKSINNSKDNNDKNEKINYKYQYLLDTLYNNCFTPEKYINYTLFSNNDKLDIAIDDLMTNKESENIILNSNDLIDTTGCTKENNELTTSNGMILQLDNISDSQYIFSKDTVMNRVKSIFGKNTTINHQTTDVHFYDKTAEAYIGKGGDCSHYDYSWFQSITKEEENTELNIYVSMASLYERTFPEKAKICYDYKDNNNCILLSKIDKKYKKDTKYDDLGYDYEKYFKDNIDKFAKYKYTFIKEDNNYIFKKLEKID